MRVLAPLFLLSACGEFVRLPAGEALDGEISVSLDADVDLSGETRLRHIGLDGLLRQITVEGAGPYGGRGVDYAALNDSAEATAALSAYLSGLATVNPSDLESPDEALAYWLNAYNAWALYAVAAKVAEDPGYDVESDGWFLFSSKFILVDGYVLTLNDLEHGVLRGFAEQPYADDALAAQAAVWRSQLWGDGPPDGRLHMGLNCASASCPELPPGAFQGGRVWDQLDAQATVFLDSAEKGAGPSGVSTLFSWFATDFTDSFGSVESFVSTYRTGGDADVDYATFLAYDWSLNQSGSPSGEEPTCAQPW